MLTEHIKLSLEKNKIQYTKDEDSFNFKHPLCPKLVDCLVTWNETRKQVQFVADYEVKLPATLSDDAFAALLNDLNYDSSFGNLETDRHGLVVYRVSTFLPDGRDAAAAICAKALAYFLNESVSRLRPVEQALKRIRAEERGAEMRYAMPESVKSRVLELECMHHRIMQLAETADILFDEYQLVCRDTATEHRLGRAGQNRVVRNTTALRREEEQLHADIQSFAERYNLPLKLGELSPHWELQDFKRDLALSGIFNTAVTELLIAVCRETDHVA